MKNGKEYRNSIRQQIIDLLEKAYLGNDERTILNKLDFGIKKTFSFDFFLLNYIFISNRNINT